MKKGAGAQGGYWSAANPKVFSNSRLSVRYVPYSVRGFANRMMTIPTLIQ